jgi:hypothetical protein
VFAQDKSGRTPVQLVPPAYPGPNARTMRETLEGLAAQLQGSIWNNGASFGANSSIQW